MFVKICGQLAAFGALSSLCLVSSAQTPAPAPPAPTAAPSIKDQCIDANEAAQRLTRDGTLAEARTQLQVCLRPECPGPVRQDCIDLAAKVEAATPTVIFEAHDAQGATVNVVHVTMDHHPFAELLDGKALPVDPGWHRFDFDAEGLPHTRQSVHFELGEKNRQVSVDLVDKSGPLMQKLGLGVAGLGVLTLAVGAYYGLESKSTYNDARKHCPNGPNSCDLIGVAGGRTAHDQAGNATLAFVFSGLLIGGGATLYVLGSKLSVTPAVTPHADTAALLVRGAW